MINAIHNGAATPGFGCALVLAEHWGVPPWVIVGEELTEAVRLKWWNRAMFYYSQIAIRDSEDLQRLSV